MIASFKAAVILVEERNSVSVVCVGLTRAIPPSLQGKTKAALRLLSEQSKGGVLHLEEPLCTHSQVFSSVTRLLALLESTAEVPHRQVAKPANCSTCSRCCCNKG